ncbi:hypothetical protein [Salinisphaera sp. T31B1]|uniref:hypothetical protein n=1 Tax=Salinisphaera sp. T31B1 TaxID=727963 RepID=UPI00333EC536
MRLTAMSSCENIQASHRRGGDVRDERADHQPAPARDETQGNGPDTGDVSESEVATHPSSPDILSPRRIEQSLRDAGLSNRQARRLMSGGYAAYAGNVDPEDREALLSELINFHRRISEFDL